MRGYRLFTLNIRPEDVEDVLDQRPDIDSRDYSQTRRYGDLWVEEGRSLALKVPSVVLPMSYNYLVNPQHPAFDPDAVTSHGAFEYEDRIARLVEVAKEITLRVEDVFPKSLLRRTRATAPSATLLPHRSRLACNSVVADTVRKDIRNVRLRPSQ